LVRTGTKYFGKCIQHYRRRKYNLWPGKSSTEQRCKTGMVIASAQVALILQGYLQVSTQIIWRLDNHYTEKNGPLRFCSNYTNGCWRIKCRQGSNLPVERDLRTKAVWRRRKTPSTISVSKTVTGLQGVGGEFSVVNSSTDNVILHCNIRRNLESDLNFPRDWQQFYLFRRNVTSTSNGNTCEASSLPTFGDFNLHFEGTFPLQTQTVWWVKQISPLNLQVRPIANF